MNDRLGGTTTYLDEGNIRYYGASPNNYIYFNCSDYNNQSASSCEVWRIIGIFDGKVKIVRNDSIGDMAWDETNSNNWARPATLNTYLNGEYYNSFKNNETRNKIAKTIWELGGYTDADVYPNTLYNYERGTEVQSTWTGNIALMYANDYGYATDFRSCLETVYNYDNVSCKNNDWLYSGTYDSLLSPYTDSSNIANAVVSDGKLGHYYMPVSSDLRSIRPSLYLNPSEFTLGGTGEKDSPYQLAR